MAVLAMRFSKELGRPGLLSHQREHLSGLLQCVLQIMELYAQHSPKTLETARRVEKLDRQLAKRPPGERAYIAQQRLGIRRTSFYKLRNIGRRLASPHANADCFSV